MTHIEDTVAHPIPTREQVKTWMREANHNEPMFYQVACMAAEWATNHDLLGTATTRAGQSLVTGTTGLKEMSPPTTATCVDGENNQTWLQPLIDRTNAVNEETARIKAETARLKKEVSPLTTATTMPLYKELKGVIGILSIYRRSEVAS